MLLNVLTETSYVVHVYVCAAYTPNANKNTNFGREGGGGGGVVDSGAANTPEKCGT